MLGEDGLVIYREAWFREQLGRGRAFFYHYHHPAEWFAVEDVS